MMNALFAVVLLVADLFHPINCLAVEFFLNSDMSHGCDERGPMPVLLLRCDLYDIAGLDLLDRTSPTPHSSTSGRNDQGLT
jgi:hypothetical protein